ncbi:MAG: endonuclease/exonuclease/phosphatase family protein [Phycisphaerales bacterium JB063]
MKHASHLILAALLVLAVGCRSNTPTQPAADPPKQLRVLTYNIHHGEGMDNRFDYERLAAVITSVNPDVVALQEVDRATGRSSGIDQAATLGQLTGMHHTFAEAMPYNGGSYGEAVLSRFPIEETWAVNLTAAPGQEPRAVAAIRVRPWGDDGPEVVFAGTHLCHQSDATRLVQAREINAAFPQVRQRTLIAGDFNFTSDTAAYNEMARRWTDTAQLFGDPQPTIPATNPRARIDYVFARPAGAWKIIDVQVIDEQVASDHTPVLVVLEVVE